MPPVFKVPALQDNADGWGPVAGPEHLRDIPYAAYGKADRLAKAADWTQQNYQRNFGRYQQGQAGGGVFNFFHNEEEETFRLVDNKPVKTQRYGRHFNQQRYPRRDEQHREREAERGGHRGREQRRQRGGGRRNWPYFNREQPKQVVYSPSIEVKPDWTLVQQIQFSDLWKLHQNVGDVEDLVQCGALDYYDKVYDRVTPKNEKALSRTNRIFRSVTTSDDPIMRRFAAEDKGRVFVTDTILTTIMCATRSVYSWDIVVTRVGDKVFFDKRDQSPLSLVTGNETSPDPVPEEKDNINGVQQLSLEATMINQNFSQQVLVSSNDKYRFSEPNPFRLEDDTAELASCAYRYRRWRFEDNENIDIIVRCEVDGVVKMRDQVQLLSVKALNEFNAKLGAGVDWRQRLESQRGAVFATELKNNSNKLAKWTAAAILAGAHLIKLGYVSRVHPKDNQRHSILGMQGCKPRELAQQINLNMGTCWGVVRAIVDICMQRPDGKYLLIKDPNASQLRLYQLPDGALEESYTDEGMHMDDAGKATLTRR
eukprot:evm.model.scf_1171.4 EVM.evm.TU.scf_1171.4   scf_1171:13412-20218(+)